MTIFVQFVFLTWLLFCLILSGPILLMGSRAVVLVAYACTKAYGRPWTAARFPIGSPHQPMTLIPCCSLVCRHFLCAILCNIHGYALCPSLVFYPSFSRVKAYQVQRRKIRATGIHVLRGVSFPGYSLNLSNQKKTDGSSKVGDIIKNKESWPAAHLG